MIVLVCGSRNWTDREAIYKRLAKLPHGTQIIHGAARGADQLAGACASTLGFSVREFPADWRGHGRAAGPIRNKRMLYEGQPDLVIAFPLPDSIGTVDMIRQARRARVPVEVIR